MVFLPLTSLNWAISHRKTPFSSIAECELRIADCENPNFAIGPFSDNRARLQSPLHRMQYSG
jgi:hypothetical protein